LDNGLVSELLLYNRLQDDLMFLGNNAVVRMNIALYRLKDHNQREYYYGETQYVDKNGYLTRRMTRRIDPFLSIESMKNDAAGNREYFVLRGKDIEFLRLFVIPKLEYIVTHFTEVFEARDGKIYINDADKHSIQVDLNYGKFMVFKPGVRKMYNDELQPVIDVYLNNTTTMTSMTIAQACEFMYLIRTIQIHQYAASMLAFFDRPPMGLNMKDISLNQELNGIEQFKYIESPELTRRRKEKGGFFNREIKRRENEKDDEK